jgi:hypothetical protein
MQRFATVVVLASSILLTLLLFHPDTGKWRVDAGASGSETSFEDAAAEVLRIIGTGFQAYNDGNKAACCKAYEDGLRNRLRPLLSKEPDLERQVDLGLTKAALKSDLDERSWELRYILDRIWLQCVVRHVLDRGNQIEEPYFRRVQRTIDGAQVDCLEYFFGCHEYAFVLDTKAERLLLEFPMDAQIVVELLRKSRDFKELPDWEKRLNAIEQRIAKQQEVNLPMISGHPVKGV